MLLKFISVRFMDINLVKNDINGGKSRQNWSYLMKMFQIGSFWRQKDIIGQYLAKLDNFSDFG